LHKALHAPSAPLFPPTTSHLFTPILFIPSLHTQASSFIFPSPFFSHPGLFTLDLAPESSLTLLKLDLQRADPFTEYSKCDFHLIPRVEMQASHPPFVCLSVLPNQHPSFPFILPQPLLLAVALAAFIVFFPYCCAMST
jgi:hypothetical protein